MYGFSSRSWGFVGSSKKLIPIITKSKASGVTAEVVFNIDGDDSEESHGSSAKTKGKSKNFSKDKDEPFLMTDDERWEFRKKIKEVMGMSPVVEEAIDPVERQKKVEKLFADYPLVVDEEDPRWF